MPSNIGAELIDFLVYRYQTPGSFQFISPIKRPFHVLIVGGGGGGGSSTTKSDPGDGGAGGLVFVPYMKVYSPINVTVVFGGLPGENGGDSVFGNYVAYGGGAGGCDSKSGAECEQGSPGGSGGGGGPNGGNGGISTQNGFLGYGNNGGKGSTDSWGNGGGGGGAGSAGAPSHNNNKICGSGGDDLSSVTIHGVTYDFHSMFGDNGEVIDNKSYFAGGGGGGGECTGVGGKGGGGTATESAASSGVPGTGGGGSGGNNFSGGPGGSGIILIYFPNPYVASYQKCYIRFHVAFILLYLFTS